MNTYFCDGCNYSTDDKSNFTKHNASKRHAEKVSTSNNTLRSTLDHSKNEPASGRIVASVIDNKNGDKVNNDSISFQCPHCNQQFTLRSSLNRHIKLRCLEKTIKENKKDDDLKNCNNELKISNDKIVALEKEITYIKTTQIPLLNERIIELKADKTYLKYLLDNVGSIAKTSVRALSYAVKNYNNAPILKELDDYSNIKYIQNDINSEETDDGKDDKEINKVNLNFICVIVSRYENDRLASYIGDFIIKIYKKKDATLQSMWNTDTNRYSYAIRCMIADEKASWVYDPAGIKVIECIVTPLLAYIQKLIGESLKKYLADAEIAYDANRIKELNKINCKMGPLSSINHEIELSDRKSVV